jgi:hypothetical protein
MTVNNTDLLLVERNGVSYKLLAGDIMADLQDTDLMLVERNGTSYKATGLDIKNSLGGGSDISSNVSGGTLYQVRNQEIDYDVRLFTSNTNLVISGTKDILMDIVIIAGGGGGASSTTAYGGGGGAGGVLELLKKVSPGTYAISIGSAGQNGTSLFADGSNGGNTTLTIGSTTFTAVGGAGGAIHQPKSGGSGGGGGGGNNIAYPDGGATAGQGHEGGSIKQGYGTWSGGGGYSSTGGSALLSGSQWAGFRGGGGGILKWHLPSSVNGTDGNGMTNFAAGGGGKPSGASFPNSEMHGGDPDAYGAGGSWGRDGKAGAVFVRYIITQ